MYEASNILKRIMLPILSKGPSKGAKTRFQILRFPPSNPIQASFLPACTGDAGDSVCLSHFLDAISQGERIHHQMFKLISPCFSKGELSPLDWPWMNKRATEGGLTGRGGCLWGVFGWEAEGKQSGVWGRLHLPFCQKPTPKAKALWGGNIWGLTLPSSKNPNQPFFNLLYYNVHLNVTLVDARLLK